jgi:hypothetical protein
MDTPRESWTRSPARAGKFISNWKWGYKATNGKMAAIWSKPIGDLRHAEMFKLPTKMSTWNEFLFHH